MVAKMCAEAGLTLVKQSVPGRANGSTCGGAGTGGENGGVEGVVACKSSCKGGNLYFDRDYMFVVTN
jgi:hypothetical protein